MTTLAAAAGLLALSASALAAEAGKLLFVSTRDGSAQIYVMSADGSGERALTRGPAQSVEPAWSPDGQRIAFTAYRDGDAEIYVMDADGGNPRRLTTHPQADDAPAWTADGRIVFRSMRDSWANFYVIDADGSNLAPLTATAYDKGPPVMSPDARWIAFVSRDDKGRSRIEVMPAAGGQPKEVVAPAPRTQKSFPSWSPDSARLAYVDAKETSQNVWVVDRDGANATPLTANAYMNTWPVWSPDGSRLAFVSGRDGTRQEQARGDIFVMSADGSGQSNLTHHPAEDNYPAWSADGRSIYFVSYRDGNAQVYAMPAKGGPVSRLTHDSGFDMGVRPLAQPATDRPLAQAAATAGAQNKSP